MSSVKSSDGDGTSTGKSPSQERPSSRSSGSSAESEKYRKQIALAALGAAEANYFDDKNDPRYSFFCGAKGKPIPMLVNYYPVRDPTEQHHMYRSSMKYRQYDVRFNSNETLPRTLRQRAIEAVPETILPKYMFSYDGNANIYIKEEEQFFQASMSHLQKEFSVDVKITAFDKSEKQVKVDFEPVKVVNPELHQCVMTIMNSTLKRALLKHTNLVMFSRCLYDTANKIKITFNQQIYFAVPGYDISVSQCRAGYYLNLDNRYRIFRSGDVYGTVFRAMNFDRAQVQQYLTGRVVYNMRSGKLFRIDKVDFDMTPAQVFDYKGDKISIADYYVKKWGDGARIMNMDSPMLVEIDRKTQAQACIPPEFCLITGLDASEKANFGLMKALTQTSKPNAAAKVKQLRAFAHRYFQRQEATDSNKDIETQKKIYNELSSAGFTIQSLSEKKDQMAQIPARLLQPPIIKFGNSATVNNSYDWTRDFRDVKPLRIPQKLEQPVMLGIVCTRRDEQTVKNFLQNLKRTTSQLGQDFTAKHRFFFTDSARAEHFKKTLDQLVAMNKASIILIGLPDDRKERYDAIKSASLCNEYPVPTQCIKTRTMGKGLSVATKLSHQMFSKLGAGLWAAIPPNDSKQLPMMSALYGKAMMVGVDVHHDPSKKGSVLAVVGSLDRFHTEFGARTVMQGIGKEMENKASAVSDAILELALDRFKTRKMESSIIIVYRDGVSRGQEDKVYETEIIALEKLIDRKRALNEIPDGMFGASRSVKIIYILVNKSHGLKMFEPKNGSVENPQIGSVLDQKVCRNTHADFYMVTATTREGMVAPVHYEMIHPRISDSGDVQWKAGLFSEGYVEPLEGITADTIQSFTFYSCYGYFNMTTPIRVPAVCQYAHKCALICGAHIHNAVMDSEHPLRNLLWYL